MNKTVVNALKAVAVLTVISIVCVGLLAVCNMFFPKYKPTLDAATLSMINSICPTGVNDAEAAEGGHIIMLDSDEVGSIDAFNKANKKSKASVLAVYAEPKGDNAGAHIFECSSVGRDGDIVLLIAYNRGVIVGASVKKQGESYYDKLPKDLLDNAIGTDGSLDLYDIVGKTGATLSLNAITRALNISATYEKENSQKIDDALAKRAEAEKAEKAEKAENEKDGEEAGKAEND